MNVCGDSIDEYSTVDGIDTHITHHCEKPKGHETLRAPFNLCSCPCLYRWEKISK